MLRTKLVLAGVVLSVVPHGYAAATSGVRPLHAQFFYEADLKKNEAILEGKCSSATGRGFAGGLAADLVVDLAGKIVESAIDAAAAKTRPEATTIEALVPLEGLYGPKGLALHNGCLVIHNGDDEKGTNATIKGIFQVIASQDGSAFRLSVRKWQFNSYLNPETSRWAQGATRDVVIRFEFLEPSSEGLGTRRVFAEYSFIGATVANLGSAFVAEQNMAWLAAPSVPSTEVSGLTMPVNLVVTIVETTKPNQFAVWLQETAAKNKANISQAVQDAVRNSFDKNAAATKEATAAEAAGTAYDAYKAAWDALAADLAKQPATPGDNASNADKAAYAVWQASYEVQLKVVEAKRVAARAAFKAAGLSWPGNLAIDNV